MAEPAGLRELPLISRPMTNGRMDRLARLFVPLIPSVRTKVKSSPLWALT